MSLIRLGFIWSGDLYRQDSVMLLEKKKSAIPRAIQKTHAAVQERSVVSFFCGCGGLDLGFLGGFFYKGTEVPKLPFRLLAAYDHDDKCIQTYVQNISDHAEVRDLSSYNPNEVPAAEVLIGGFPCQDFATCGPRHGLKSTRGRLYQALIQYMEVHRPLVVIGENVPGLANIRGLKANRTKTYVSEVTV